MKEWLDDKLEDLRVRWFMMDAHTKMMLRQYALVIGIALVEVMQKSAESRMMKGSKE